MDNKPIIVKRVKKFAGGHHGGAWKIAFADFMTAMMAFFLVLWLLGGATDEQLKAISSYFQDPIGFSDASPYVIDLGGSPTPAPQKTLNPESVTQEGVQQMTKQAEPPPAADSINNGDAANAKSSSTQDQQDQDNLAQMLRELQARVENTPELKRFQDQIHFEITQDGLRIQIQDSKEKPMFNVGSDKLDPHFEDMLLDLGDVIKRLPNKISISGHTDAKSYYDTAEFSNWELSTERANAARRALVEGGYPEDQIARIVGYAASALYDPQDPYNPRNRRIDIIVLNKKAEEAIRQGEENGGNISKGDKDTINPESIQAEPKAPADASATSPAASASGTLPNAPAEGAGNAAPAATP
ncbi:motility protein MotB [Pokkaliibacter plantistimulans]|uniref:Motility protein MotB n=1 Tax=Proteobacteria bacterium 228 TaxID=2083153 RepID=A0A2S5KIG3_9PROT|nr:flagellar motor protein MotB [Pokkaliibacter plantistimulans]PPC74611.1 motility protein MotB [Pokkaliibacter plantistimulans]